jgi:hypothetical protein
MFHEKDMWKCKHKIAAIIELERRAAKNESLEFMLKQTDKIDSMEKYRAMIKGLYLARKMKGNGTEPEGIEDVES